MLLAVINVAVGILLANKSDAILSSLITVDIMYWPLNRGPFYF